MIDRRIRLPKDKDEFIENLLSSEEGRRPFQYKVDVLAFAAILGATENHKISFSEATKEPIRQEVFDRQGYDTVMNLLAVYDMGTPAVLSDEDDNIEQRASIFEAYANGGLELLRERFKGAADYLNEVLLLINEKKKKEGPEITGDLTELLR
jgi:dnd system-associated protein 4